jgi:hypothetical protein
VETVLRSLSVDDIIEERRNLILSALEMIREGGDSMDDATGDDAMDDTTVEVDEVLDKILDNAIEAYGSSARDVYRAIISPDLAKNRIDAALSFQE